VKQLVAIVLGVMACDGPAPAPTSLRSADVAGSWGRPDSAFPPVNLMLTDSAGSLHARLRLSGSERHGSATLNGKQLRIVFEGPETHTTGEFVSTTELRLEFGGVGPYTLYRSAGGGK
jgi:hypothetical protein